MNKGTDNVSGLARTADNSSEKRQRQHPHEEFLRALWDHCHKYPNDAELGSKLRELILTRIFSSR